MCDNRCDHFDAFACRMDWPVSTTHTVFGAIIGEGVAGFTVDTVEWCTYT